MVQDSFSDYQELAHLVLLLEFILKNIAVIHHLLLRKLSRI